jgi:integrase
MKIAKAFPHLYKDKDGQRRDRWRLRVPGRKATTIKGRYGTPEFAAAYTAALAGAEPTEKKGLGVPKQGTIAALARSYLRSGVFAGLSPATQRARRYLVERFVAEHGDKEVARLERRHVKAIIDAKRETPGLARNILSMLGVLLALAVEDGIRADNPAKGIKRPKLSDEGWHPWTEEQIATYEVKQPVGSQARLALALALYTAQRRSDVARMGRQHVRNGVIDVRQQKTGTKLAIPLHPTLQAILDATPSAHLTFLVAQHGKPFTPGGLTQRFKLWCREAGLRQCSMHGLRKAACRRLAEAGCTAHEIMAISGHKTLSEVERYTKDADQRRMAERAIARTETFPRGASPSPTEKKA